jgi:hypothetical protein
MKRLFAFSTVLPLLLLFSFMGTNAQAQLELIENGGFETGDFTGWTVVQELGSAGDWFVYSGTVTPVSSHTVLPPPDGTFAAVSDQGEPSSQVLFQDIVVPPESVTCSVVVYYLNSAEGFVTAPDLSYQTFPNQQARIDIMDPAADPFDVGAGVLLNIFQTNPGDPLSLGYTTLDFDLSQFAGTTVRFRAAEVDNEGYFNFSIDDVICGERNVSRPIPTLGEWGMIAMAGALGLAGLIFASRRRGLTA